MTRAAVSWLSASVLFLILASTGKAAGLGDNLKVLYEFDTLGMPEINSAATGNDGTPGNLIVSDVEKRIGAGSADFGTGEPRPTKAYLVVDPADVAALSPGVKGSFTTSYWWKPTTGGPPDDNGRQQSFWASADDPNLPIVKPGSWPPFPQTALSYIQGGVMHNLFRDAGLSRAAEASDDVTVSPNFFDGSWHHIAETYVVDTTLVVDDVPAPMKLFSRFLDGQPAGTASSAEPDVVRGWVMQNMILGQQYDDAPLGNSAVQDLDGYLDDFAVWSRTLTNQEILDIYNGGLLGNGIADLIGTVVLPGDVNFDGVVNIFDINLVSSHWGEGGPMGDANGDSTVNIFDINLISANWTPTGSTSVPEPSTIVLLALGIVFVPARLLLGHIRTRNCL